MVRYTDENGKVHELDRYPIADPYSEVFHIARARAVELRNIGNKLGEAIIYAALTYFSKGVTEEPPPRMEDERADALLQKIIKEAKSANGGENE